jgi:hypothetical protein
LNGDWAGSCTYVVVGHFLKGIQRHDVERAHQLRARRLLLVIGGGIFYAAY